MVTLGCKFTSPVVVPAEGGAEDAERAIASARKAFDEGP